jgi:cation diffusion facilitator CzcD-associated flavoprotein CzcO
MACSHGAARVDMFYRRKEMVKVNPYRWAEFVGFLKHHADLASDEDKWNFMRQFIGMGQLPPPDTYQTATSFAQFSLHPGSSWQQLREAEGKVEVTTAQGTFFFDQLIIGTGFVTDLGRRPELAELYPYMALWHDRFTPEQQGMEDFLRFPYLGAGSSFQEKHPGQAPFIRGLFNFNFGCILSNGLGGASLSGMKYSLRRLCDEITRQFYIEAKDEHLESLTRFDRADFLGKEDER